MSIQYVEKLGSRNLSRSGEDFTASRTFLVYDDDEDRVLSVADAVNYSNGVEIGNLHPDNSGIYATGFSINASGERANTWEIVWDYGIDEPEDEGDNTGEDDDIFDDDVEPDETNGEQGDDGISGGTDSGEIPARLFTGVSLTTGVALVDGFVAGATIPSGGTETGSAITTGTNVHQGGEPVTIPVPTTEITLSETQFGEYFFLNNVQLRAGKRNSSTFYGFSTGSVIFKGMSVQRSSVSQWDVSYNFTWDAWSHMRQVIERDTDGNAVVAEDGTADIFFKQPFPDTTSFNFSP